MDKDDLKKIFELKQEINKLLQERPELIPLQRKIDEVMKSAGNSNNRLTLINSMMMDSFHEMKEVIDNLLIELHKLQQIAGNKSDGTEQ